MLIKVGLAAQNDPFNGVILLIFLKILYTIYLFKSCGGDRNLKLDRVMLLKGR